MSKRFAVFGALVIAATALVTYQPGLKVGFFNGWWYLEWVGTMDVPRYLIQFLDPRNVTQGYRPVQGLYVLAQYTLFHFNPDGFLLSQMAFHAANGVLLFFVVAQLGRRPRVAFVAALVYAVLPAYSLAVFWHAVVDPLSAFFYLLTILLWTRYQESKSPLAWAATYAAYLFALFSKEVAVFLPVFLFLIERWFYHVKPGWRRLVREYAPFVVVFIPYVLLELNVQSHGEFVGQFKFSVGPHMLTNALPYLAVLAFPWTTDLPTGTLSYIWLAVALVAYVAVMVYKKSAVLLFLGIFAVLNIVPLLGFPQDYFNTRYLYTSTMVSAVLIAIMVELGFQTLKQRRAVVLAGALAVLVIVVGSSARVADAATGLAEYTRQLRVPFRDISRQHPTFPDDSYVYFVYSPATPLSEFEGMFFVRYGTTVTVDGTDMVRLPELRRHRAAFVYYFDETGKPVEVPVEKNIAVNTAPAPPARFQGPITLEGYDVTGTTLARGKSMVVFLSWSTAETPDKDYTIFVHLVDANGKLIAGQDAIPGRGEMPTGRWRRGRPVSDALVLAVPADAPAGENYRLEVGMYDPSAERPLPLVDANGQPARDAFVIQPFRIVP